ncbi:MAG TPA: heparan-alpha-glucosaminide N-acetyltransferase domain-containing protein, partial [Vicinamibacterales bacterium]|nr:heparan-alpha-glucosaminide N-acetyltransferase domain-containing protein [Vicinamibacterales bacterium]
MPRSSRLRSLDVFRGLTMASMVIVNNPGDWATVYAPLLHAEWHGWTPTDLIFPFFIFILGVAMAQADPGRTQVRAVLRRGAILVGLGLFMAGFPFFNTARWRIPGVLFRLGVSYVAAAFTWRALAAPGDQLATLRRTLAAAACCLLGYWMLVALVAPPGGVAGDLSPEGNLGAWLDRAIFGTHLWQVRWDPEGLLSSLPAVGTALMGLAAGLWLRLLRPASGAPAVVYAGAAAVLTGLMWDRVFPINKALWTSSYALFTAGAAALALGVLHHRLDDGRAPAWLDRATEPLVALGRNALLLFVLSGLAAKSLILLKVGGGPEAISAQRWIYTGVFVPLASPKVASLLFALANLAMLYALLAWLH